MANGDRLRIPVGKDYPAALGLAVVAWALAEWNAVWCCERIDPGCISTLSHRTSARIAGALVRLSNTLPPSDGKTELVSAAARFKTLVQTRNELVHGKPANINGENMLNHNGRAWTFDELANAADEFTACSGRLNACLHGFLMANGS